MSLMRRSLLWASENSWLARRLPRLGFVRRATRRFMPGEVLEDAVAEAVRLDDLGASTILTLLGENLDSLAEADEVVDEYLRILDEARDRGLDLQVSVKPTQLGLDLDRDGAFANLERIVRHAEQRANFVWIDMEGSAYTDVTLELFRGARAERSNVGLALQAYLYRTKDDLESLLPLDPAIRLVKGAYAEPEAIAFPKKRDVDASFERLALRLIDHVAGTGAGLAVFGTHDPRLIRRCQDEARSRDLDRSLYEFDLLYGIGRAEQERLLAERERLRVLISYGSAWFPWYMRRLAERPANVWFVARQLLSR